MIIRIQQMYHTLSGAGSPDRITRIDFEAVKTQDNISVVTQSSISVPSDYAPASVAYSTITEATAISWVENLADMVSIEAELDAQLQKSYAPDEGHGLPWVSSYALWVGNYSYPIGYNVSYNSILYRCVQAHTSSSTWTPDVTPALWTLEHSNIEGPDEWVQPQGAHDAYHIGDQVTHNGQQWETTIDNNVWEPGVYGWVVF